MLWRIISQNKVRGYNDLHDENKAFLNLVKANAIKDNGMVTYNFTS